MTTVRIPVDVDTRKATADLKQLHRDKGRQQKRVARASTRASRGFAMAAGFTGAVASLARSGSAPSAGNVDIAEEALVPLRALASMMEEKTLGHNAAALKKGRAETQAAFRHLVGQTGSTAGVQSFFDTATRYRQEVESGRSILRRDPKFVGATAGDYFEAKYLDPAQRMFYNLSQFAAFSEGLVSRAFEWFLAEVNEEN